MSTIDRGTVGNRMAIERISKIKSHLIFRNGCTLNKIKADIYALMSELKEKGKSIIMISEEIPELLGMADRIIIMKDGKISGEFARDPALGEEDLIANMV